MFVEFSSTTEGVMINFEQLQEKMREKGYSSYSLSQILNIPHSDFLNKLYCKKEFSISELYRIAIALELTPHELSGIFFSDGVEFNSTK